MAEFDYVIVGAGSAGCVLANRLSADPASRVLLIEAGGRDRNPLLRVPILTGHWLRGRRHNWSYETEPQPGLDGRRLAWPRGKVLGGSSAINGMVYTRGLRSDYDTWAQAGLAGWSYDDVLPYFRRSEDRDAGADEFHGEGGPLAVSRPQSANPLFDSFLDASAQAGYPRTDDFNGARQEGFGRYDFNIRNGRRNSSATAFLDPVRARPNLAIWTGCQARCFVLEEGRATGIELLRNGARETVTARREIVLSGGVVNSPQLLMLSGIGPADELRRHGIAVVRDMPGVGQNLQDHVLARVQFACRKPITLHGLRRPDRAVAAVLRALVFGTGPGAAFPVLSGGFFRSRPELDEPDMQCHFLPGLTSGSLRLNPFSRRGVGNRHGFMANVYQLRPLSRGSITLRGADPMDPPAIQPNYLAEEADRRTLIDGVRALRRIFAQPAFDNYRGEELAPGPGIETDDEIAAWIRQTADTVFHPVGTCKMGVDNMAVVDAALRVHGIDGLRVADASVMPRITSSNTHAPTVMIAEKASEMIRTAGK